MIINNKTNLYLSCSASPGNFGSTLYNYFFNKYDINAVYLPRHASNPKQVISALKNLNCQGCSISMPLKSQIIPFLDELSVEARESNSVNTITNINGIFKGHNTDIYGAYKALEDLKSIKNVLVYGSGSVVESIIIALRKIKATNISINARNESFGEEISRRHNVNYLYDINSLSNRFDLLINATPAKLNKNLKKLIDNSDKVFDLVVSPIETQIIKYAEKSSKESISGIKMTKYQFQQQFYLYTNIQINMYEIDTLISKLFIKK